MATAQLQRPKGAVDTWTSMMPDPTISILQSESFVKKLVALGISNVTYLRAVFPDQAYVDRQLEGIRLKILRDDGTCPAAAQVVAWLKSAFDAVSKKYLRQLILAIHMDGTSPDNALETYSFHFTYKDENLSGCSILRKNNKTNEEVASVMNASLTEIRGSTLEMLRTTIQLTQSLPVLPDKCGISMKLLYYEDVTPDDYEPPGFYAAENSAFMFPSESLNCKLGEVKTPFHTLKFNAKMEITKLEELKEVKAGSHKVQNKFLEKTATKNTTKLQTQDLPIKLQSTQHTQHTELDNTCNSINEDGNDAADSVMTEDLIPSTQPRDVRKSIAELHLGQPAENVAVPSCSPAQPASGSTLEVLSGVDVTPTDVREHGIRCVCGIGADSGLMVHCKFCNHWQHGACYGLQKETDMTADHVCEICHKPGENRWCTDTKLLSLSMQQRQEVSLYRRTLACIQLCRVTPSFISQELDVSEDIAQLLFEHLEMDGVLRPSRNKGMPRSINQKVLKNELLPKYFGPTADLSSHKYNFNSDDPMDNSTEDLKEMALSPKASECKRQKRVRTCKMKLVIEEDEKPARKRQKTSQTDVIL